ncbi:MAG: hypothetical protein GF344_20840 [Chitinivibrionales bacterium]|nr:hypothetical protein [Chitinivibrionales bacterium]MBD3359044.1 hypothetical protein [Chitinivibrionales bacterium]
MKGSRCRLFDESLVRNIMVSTGISMLEYMKKNKCSDVNDICDFVDAHADDIIESTIDEMTDDESG